MPTLRSKNNKVSIGITLGDPFGIGPEVVARALGKPSIRSLANFTVIGDAKIFLKYFKQSWPRVAYIDSNNLNGAKLHIGKAHPLGAKCSLNYLERAVLLIKEGALTALVTAPVSKEAISLLNPSFIGHTEFLAEAFRARKIGMMFVSRSLRTILVTRHIPLAKVSQNITASLVYDTIELAHHNLKKLFGINHPRIAVCGLNPHAGEGGILGDEELKKIIPAIAKARRNKIKCEGPFAADTLFSPLISVDFDIIVAMYHDQGLIPIKTLALFDLVNLTIGLPFIRTSPAHGTAFNIAGKNKANSHSMEAAIRLAAQLSSKIHIF